MKKTIKDLYNIEPKALIKYTDKVYKVKNENEEEYCLKYVDNLCNNSIIEKIHTLNLNENFQMPIKNCVRSNHANVNNKLFYVSKWVEDDMIESKDLKIKHYLNQIGKLHKKTAYTLNVSASFFNEITMQIFEDIEKSYQYYEKVISSIEKLEYKSPFMWYFIEQYKNIIESLNKAKSYLEEFKKTTKEKLVIRQVIIHQNFSYDHVFISKNVIIGNDKLKQASPVYDLKSLFEKIEFGSVDLSGIIDEYLHSITLEEYELYWLFSLLYIISPLKIENNEIENISNLTNVMFKYKSINELENKLLKK